MTVASWPSAMTIVDVYTLLLEILLEAAVLAALFAMLWLAFWVRDRHPDARLVGQPRPTDAPVSDITSAQRDFATVARPLAPVRIASGGRRPIHLASSDVQPASEKDEAILYRPEHAQHFNDKPQNEPSKTSALTSNQ